MSKLTVHLALIRKNNLASATWRIYGKCLLKTLFNVGTPHSLRISRRQVLRKSWLLETKPNDLFEFIKKMSSCVITKIEFSTQTRHMNICPSGLLTDSDTRQGKECVTVINGLLLFSKENKNNTLPSTRPNQRKHRESWFLETTRNVAVSGLFTRRVNICLSFLVIVHYALWLLA